MTSAIDVLIFFRAFFYFGNVNINGTLYGPFGLIVLSANGGEYK